MKIIVSTKMFAQTITHAIEARATHFELFVNQIKFTNNTSSTYAIQTITQAIDNTSHNYEGCFHLEQWYNLLQFLKSLEEQPIVVEFIDYNEDVHKLPAIELSQFIKRF